MQFSVNHPILFLMAGLLGAGGSYLSFVTGNISNLKLPCALNALELWASWCPFPPCLPLPWPG